MPELPEVETVRRGLAPHVVGAAFSRVEQRRRDLRFPFPRGFVHRLEGRRVERLDRRAKYLMAHLDDGSVLAMHLGMSGRFSVSAGRGGAVPGAFLHAAGGDPRHDHVVFTMTSGARVVYNDARRFGFMMLVGGSEMAAHPRFAPLGVEPLGDELTEDYLMEAARGRIVGLKSFLLDQRVIAGLGNIYVCEVLHRAGLTPSRAASDLTGRGGRKRTQALIKAIRTVLADAISAGGSSLRDYRQADGALGYFQHSFQVYGRDGEPCLRRGCVGVVQRTVDAGRSTFFCDACQS